MIASAGSDGKILLWTWSGGELIETLVSHTGGVWGLAWSPDKRWLASAGDDGVLRVWDISSRRLAWQWKGPGGSISRGRAFCVCFAPDSKQIVCGYGNGSLALFDVNSQTQRMIWPGHIEGGHSTEVITVGWSPDGREIVSGGIDYAARLWTDQGEPVAVLRAATEARNDINGVAWSPDGKVIATAGQDGVIRLWDRETCTETLAMSIGPGQWIRGVSWSPDGELLATTGGGWRSSFVESSNRQGSGSARWARKPDMDSGVVSRWGLGCIGKWTLR